MVKRFLLSVVIFLFAFVCIQPCWSNEIDELINSSDIAKNSIVSVSVRDIQTNEIVYEKNSNLLLHPASTLKLFTSAAVFNYLGAAYSFKTSVYQKGRNFYLKLSGDPNMDEKMLANLVSQLRLKEIKTMSNLYIDDSAIDNESWGIGWMNDDNTNPLFPPFNSYNLNHNLIALKIAPSKDSKPKINIFPSKLLNINNRLINSSTTTVNISRNMHEDPNTIIVKGGISKERMFFVPVSKPSVYFLSRLYSNLEKYGINVNPKIKNAAVPSHSKKVASVSTNLIDILPEINKISDNFAAEVVLKHAGAKFSRKTGTTSDGLSVFKKYYDKRGVNTSSIYVVDACGASHNDLLTADWMSRALVSISKEKNFDKFKQTLAQPSEYGTLKNRLSYMQGYLGAKTGTLAGISAITGYMQSKNGKRLTFSILIQNFKGSSRKAKALEDDILGLIYRN